MQNINVNIVPDNFPQTIRYSQGDIGRQFKINVTDFDIPVGATVKIQATKPSGFGFSVAGVVAGSSVTFTTTAEMTDEAGRFQAELQITAGDDVIGTANFLMIGEQNPHPEGTTDGSQGTIIPELTLLVERVEKAASDVLDMEVVATTLPAGSQATYSYDEDLNKATFGIPEGQAGAGAAGVVASAYSAAKTYKVGDYVLYNSNLYRCTTAITTAEAWTAAHWTQIVLADDVTDLKSDLDNKIGLYGDSETYIDCLKTNDPDYLSGKAYSSNTGNIVSVSGCSITGYIYLSYGEKLTVNYNLPDTTATIKLAKYNTSKQWVSTTIKYESSTGSKTYEYTADSNCYVRVQIWNINLPASIYVQNLYKIRKEAMNLDSVLPNQVFNMYLSGEYANLIDENDSDFLRDKAYSSNTSNIVTFANCNISNYIFVPKGEILHIGYELPSTSYQIKYAVYDSSKVWIKTVVLSTSVQTGTQAITYTAEADCYVRIQFYPNNQSITATEESIRKFKGDLTTGTQYSDKKGVAFGTSLSYRAINSYGYLDYLPSLCGAEIDNQGLGSSTILPHASTTNMLANIKAYDDFADKDFCLFEGFVNDWYYNATSALLGTFKDDDETTVCGCVRSAINYIRTQKPYITIIAILDHVGQNSGTNCSSTAENSGGLTQCEYYDTIAKVFESLSIPVIPLYKMSQMNEYTPNYFVDNIHPSDLGAEHTAREIWYRMKDIPLN